VSEISKVPSFVGLLQAKKGAAKYRKNGSHRFCSYLVRWTFSRDQISLELPSRRGPPGLPLSPGVTPRLPVALPKGNRRSAWSASCLPSFSKTGNAFRGLLGTPPGNAFRGLPLPPFRQCVSRPSRYPSRQCVPRPSSPLSLCRQCVPRPSLPSRQCVPRPSLAPFRQRGAARSEPLQAMRFAAFLSLSRSSPLSGQAMGCGPIGTPPGNAFRGLPPFRSGNAPLCPPLTEVTDSRFPPMAVNLLQEPPLGSPRSRCMISLVPMLSPLSVAVALLPR
jgi:hypothetical protein